MEQSAGASVASSDDRDAGRGLDQPQPNGAAAASPVRGANTTPDAGAASAGSERCHKGSYDPAAPPRALVLSGDLDAHDPALIETSAGYYLVRTGAGAPLGAKESPDLLTWHDAAPVFTAVPSWIAERVPGVTNLWAPDVSYFGGSYHLYYAASTFGSNRSCIGHATRSTLSAGAWTDRGEVLCSNVAEPADYNAIDPNVVVDADGEPWLVFGSFWSGIKLVRLDASGARRGSDLFSLAGRPNAGGAVEAPFIVRRCEYYYLFVSWDRCCQGVQSTYHIRVGRSKAISGPYRDRSGMTMRDGGGTLVLQGDARWKGPGHNAVFTHGDQTYHAYHAYDADADGRPTLRIAEIAWDADGWPVSGGP